MKLRIIHVTRLSGPSAETHLWKAYSPAQDRWFLIRGNDIEKGAIVGTFKNETALAHYMTTRPLKRSPSRDRSRRQARRDVARSPTPRRRPTPPSRPYRLERLTAREFATLEWLADRGYDGDLLRLAGVDDEAADGSIRLGALTEAEAWQFNENVEEDPHAFLSSNGSASLREKMYRLLDAIV